MDLIEKSMPVIPNGDSSAGRLRRRAFTGAMGCVALAPGLANAQSAGRLYRIGMLWLIDPNLPKGVGNFPQFAQLGLVEGVNLVIDSRAAGNLSRLDAAAVELVALQPDVIVVVSGTAGALAAKRATTTIPIVLYLVNDPVGTGLVQSLSHPGGNVTGNALFSRPLDLKRFQLLIDTVGTSAAIAVVDPSFTDALRAEFLSMVSTKAAARPGRVGFFEVRDASELDSVFERIAQEGFEAVAINQFPLASNQTDRIAGLIGRYRLPAIADGRSFAEAGVLLTYSTDTSDLWRRTAQYVHSILKGAKPGDLAIELPSRFEFIVNAKTAKALGIAVPPSILARADRVIG